MTDNTLEVPYSFRIIFFPVDVVVDFGEVHHFIILLFSYLDLELDVVLVGTCFLLLVHNGFDNTSTLTFTFLVRFHKKRATNKIVRIKLRHSDIFDISRLPINSRYRLPIKSRFVFGVVLHAFA